MPSSHTPFAPAPGPCRRGRRAAVRTLATVALLSALPLSAQARLALSTAINRAARFRALSQRMAKAYAQLQLGVLPERAGEVLAAARQQVRAGFEDLAPDAWPPEVARPLADVRQHAGRLEALAAQPPSKDAVAAVSAQSDRMLEAANTATQALEKLAQASTARIVNTAGRQRMLSQRLAKNYDLLALGVDARAAREQMAADAGEFRRALAGLEKAPVSTPAIRAELELGQAQWVFFDAALQRQPDARGLEAVATTSERLLEVMDRLTGLYEAALRDVLG